MKKAIWYFLILIFSLVCSSRVMAETFACSEGVVEKEAKVGVPPRTAVTITEDEGAQECFFSIDGAKVGSPSQSEILSGFNSIISRQIVEQLRSREVNSLAFAMLASARVESIPSSLQNLLSEYSMELSKCFKQFFNESFLFRLEENDLLCRTWLPDMQGRITVSGPTLEIEARWEGIRSRLFLPLNYRQEPLNYQQEWEFNN